MTTIIPQTNRKSTNIDGSGPVGEVKLSGWKNIPLETEWIEFQGGCIPLSAVAGTRNDDNTFTPYPGTLRLPIWRKTTAMHGKMHRVANGEKPADVYAPKNSFSLSDLAYAVAEHRDHTEIGILEFLQTRKGGAEPCL